MKALKKFISSIYLGDRFCEKVEIRENKILIQMNSILRIKENIGEWNCCTGEDIEHGYLVFDEVVSVSSSSELLFNDEIYEIRVNEKKDEWYSFTVYGCNVSDDAISSDIELHIKAKRFYLFDPQKNCKIIK